MSTLTVGIEVEVLARARELAAARNMTVAQVFQRLLRAAATPTFCTATSFRH